MFEILKSCLPEQLIRIMGVNLNFEKSVEFVVNPITVLQIVFTNTAKMKKENGFFNPGRNHL